jgi:putative cardiolipin synthase
VASSHLNRWYNAAIRRLPRHVVRGESHAIDTQSCRLAQSISARVQSHPGRSGIVELRDGRDAFAARAHLADAADYTLDIQYYIWRADMSGTLLFEAIRRAADRGVRVRLLLDDNNTNGLDDLLAALDSHPNIEIRLFNPFVLRRFRTLNIYDFARLNRRMHNKSFTADNQVTIVGGRNVGDEYFAAHQKIDFVDLDVMAIGPVVTDVSKDFERYWRSESAYPVASILKRPSRASIQALAETAQRITHEPAALAYVGALRDSRFVQELMAGTLRYEWAVTRTLSDDPSKVLGRARPYQLLSERLSRALEDPKRELQLVTAYLVPTKAGMQALTGLARSGVRITILTNSLEATDVGVVHAGYAKRRKQLLKAGIRIFELKRLSGRRQGRDRALTGSSGSSLHAKTFGVDRERVFVGSLNFDPRSARLNTEMGFVISSPVLASRLADAFASEIPERSYEVRLSRFGRLEWVERREGETIVHKQEPGAGVVRLFGLYLLSKLPIEWML